MLWLGSEQSLELTFGLDRVALCLKARGFLVTVLGLLFRRVGPLCFFHPPRSSLADMASWVVGFTADAPDALAGFDRSFPTRSTSSFPGLVGLATGFEGLVTTAGAGALF